MELKNFQQVIVDNFKTVHQSFSETAVNIPWSDLYADGRAAALKAYSTGSRIYTSTSQWVRGVDWAKHYRTAENVASLIADLSVIAYAAAKPLAIASYKAAVNWAKKVDWLDVLEIMVVGFIHFVQGVYEAGVKTGRWVHEMNDVLAREFVYLTGALERPASASPTAATTGTPTAPATAATGTGTQHQVNQSGEVQSPAVQAVETVSTNDAVDVSQITAADIETFIPSFEDWNSNPFQAEIEVECMEKLSETNAVEFVVEPQEVSTEHFEKTEDSVCAPVQHPLYAQLESMTVKQLREVSGVYNKQTKKEDLINAAGLKLAM